MRPIRILILGLIALFLSISGVPLAGHAAAIGAAATATDVSIAPAKHAACCHEVTERSAACHILTALIPVSTAMDASADRTPMVFPAPPILPSGHEPDGPLDPPRLA